MAKTFPSTQAVHLLRANNIVFDGYHYRFESKGQIGKHAAASLGVPESEVYKTLVFESANGPILILVDSSHQVALHKLSKAIGLRKRVMESSYRDAERYTGYKVGGISPFGTRRRMPVYLDSTALELERIYVNGGSHGFMILVQVSDLIKLLKPVIADLRSE